MITQTEYKLRRDLLAKKLDSDSITLVLGARTKTRSHDTEYPYRQNSHFYYLSGFKEDTTALMIVKQKRKTICYLFVAKKDPKLELWSGKRLGKESAKEQFMFDEVYEFEDLLSVFKEHLPHKQTLYYDFLEENAAIEPFKNLCKSFYAYKNIAKEIELMRLYKSPDEIALIKKALSITQEAHHSAMKHVISLEYEHELQAEIEYVFKKNGAYSDAYTSIVASANAANTLHYVSNDKKIQKDALLLIDAGCEFDYYSSDITRTIPASGRYSEPQKELYEMVLSVEKEIISMVKPGVLRSQLQKKSEELLCAGMIKLGILKGEQKALFKRKAHKKYYPHGIGHWMGLDVHDEATYKTKNFKEIPLQAGMVMTIEPGIYLDKDDEDIPQKYRGIGIRIEDDILVVADGYENLSQKIVKEIADIEAIANK